MSDLWLQIAGRLEDSLESHRRELDERARETEGLRAVMAGMEVRGAALFFLFEVCGRAAPQITSLTRNLLFFSF